MNTTKLQNVILGVFLFGTALFNILDYFFTMHVLSRGYEEWNPFIDIIVGTPLFPLLKILIIPTILAAIWLLRYHISARLIFYAGFLFSVYSMLMIYFGIIML